LIALVAFTLAASCRRESGSQGGSPKVQTLAKVGDKTITSLDFQSRLREQPAFSIARYNSPERRKEFLEGLVRNELLLQEARRRGLENDPEVKAALEKMLIHRLTRVYVEEKQKAGISEHELRAYYDQHRSEFIVPTRIRVSHVFLEGGDRDPRRARTSEEAVRLLREIKLKESQGEKQVLELAASRRSDDAATKATGGDLGFKTREELAQLWGPGFTEAAFGLKATGEIGTVVTTDKGLHLIKLLGRQEGYETPFESARNRIEGRLKVEGESHSLDDLVAELKKKVNVRIDEQALSAVEVLPPPASSR
jgi:peptidyl-prolyl cis-trans isomerase C